MKSTKFTKETIAFIGIQEEKNYPRFIPGDTVCVTITTKDGDKERLQNFEGIVIGIKGYGTSKSFRVRKISAGIAVEKIFPYYSPSISSIKVLKNGNVRRAKLYYLRYKIGKDAIVKTKKIKVTDNNKQQTVDTGN